MNGYGFSADDPIRVSGFYEEEQYLECLREAGRSVPMQYERLGSCRSERTGHIIDVYRIRVRTCLFPKHVTVYVDIYGERDWRAPEGFRLDAPAPSADEGGKKREAAESLFQAVREIAMLGGDSDTDSDKST